MDTKSLARSKRAHSLHHSKKHHPSPKPQAPPSGAPSGSAGANKASGKQVPDKAQSRPKPKLPSNWDRYDEEQVDSGLAESSSEVQVSDVPAPKSKGADYRHLIAEAQSQSKSQSVSDDPCLDGLVSLGDVLPEFFGGGASAWLSVRGEAVLSWANEDSFIVDDKATSGHEVPFLSLNLNALAEQLAKVDLAELLFIESDLLPPEMNTGLYIASSEKASDQITTYETEAAKSQLDVLPLDDFAREERNEEESKKSGTGRNNSDSVLNFPDDNISVDTSEVSSLGRTIVSELTDQSIKKSDIDLEKRNSTFEVAAAEAELDVLLNSFSDTKLTEPSGFGFSKSTPAFQEQTPTSMPQASGRGFISSVATPVPDSAKIDVFLDDLLEETSNFAQQDTRHSVLQTRQVNSVSHGVQSSPPVVTKSKELDDFDSWLDTI